MPFCRCWPFLTVQRKLSEKNICLCIKHKNSLFLAHKCKLNQLISHESASHFVASLCCDKDMRNQYIDATREVCRNITWEFQTRAFCDSDLTFYYNCKINSLQNTKESIEKNGNKFTVIIAKESESWYNNGNTKNKYFQGNHSILCSRFSHI